MTYAEKLKDPRWQRFRLEIMQRDDFKCVRCNNSNQTLHIHHKRYFKGLNPWEYDHVHLETLCEQCHIREHEAIPEIEPDRKYEHLLIYEHAITPQTSIQTHIDILFNTLRKGVPADLEEEILKNIVFLQQKRKEILNG